MHGVADYISMLYGLLPRGIIWQREPNSAMDKLITATAVELSRLDGEGLRLIEEVDPQSSVEAISDWERVLGLPDQCGSSGDTLEERRAQVLGKLVRPVGQNAEFFEELARSLGYQDPTVETFEPFRVEGSGADDALNDAPGGVYMDYSTTPPTATPSQYHGWAFVWLLRVSATSIREFGVDVSGAEDHLRSWGDAKLECLVRRAAPAHTHVLFGYGKEVIYA